MGVISKGVANTLKPAKIVYKKDTFLRIYDSNVIFKVGIAFCKLMVIFCGIVSLETGSQLANSFKLKRRLLGLLILYIISMECFIHTEILHKLLRKILCKRLPIYCLLTEPSFYFSDYVETVIECFRVMLQIFKIKLYCFLMLK